MSIVPVSPIPVFFGLYILRLVANERERNFLRAKSLSSMCYFTPEPKRYSFIYVHAHTHTHTHTHNMHRIRKHSIRKQYVHRFVNSIIFIQAHREIKYLCASSSKDVPLVRAILERSDRARNRSLSILYSPLFAFDETSNFGQTLSFVPFERCRMRVEFSGNFFFFNNKRGFEF